jgi:Uma2 family endonuclease
LLIGGWLEGHPIGRLFHAPFDVVFSDFDVVEPDLLFMSNERAVEILTHKHVRGAPDLVVEISSSKTRRRDEIVKRRLYERTGVSEYWVVDPDVDRVHRPEGARFGRAFELSREENDVLTTPLPSGLEMPLARIFRD